MRIRNTLFFSRLNNIHKTVRIVILLAIFTIALGAVCLTRKNSSRTTPGAKALNSSTTNTAGGSLSWVSEFNWNNVSIDHDAGSKVTSTKKRFFLEGKSSAAKEKPQEQINAQVLSSESDFNRASTNYPTRSSISSSQDRDSDASRQTQQSNRDVQGPGDRKPTEVHLRKAHSFDGDLRNLPYVPPVKRERPEREPPEIEALPYPFASPNQTAQANSSQLSIPSPAAPAPTPNSTFDGLDFATWGNGHPPDTNGDVGPNYYIQTVNTSIGIYIKSTGVRTAAFTFNTFMSQGNFGNVCDTDNFGDPVVVYDTFEDRWIITDFAFQLDGSQNVINPPGAFQCFAVSKTGDPVSGGWNYYSINTTGGLGDYPKFGIWPDGLYMSVNMFDYAAAGSFQNVRVYAFNKAQMYAGAATVQSVSFDAPSAEFTILPANARLQTGTPPAGSPNYMAVVWQFLNAVSVYKFHVDWNSVSTSTFTGPFTSLTATSWAQMATAGTVSEPAGTNALDTLHPRLMMQNQYSNIGGVESLWNSHTVAKSSGSATSDVRYYQVKVTGGTVEANATQAATWNPDTTNRFMPSTAVDRVGDMAIGYTTSSTALFPGLKYAGRLSTDPANTLSLTESTLFQGTGGQSGLCGGITCVRWGDYSAMTLDPDGCTFWYTNEYYATSGLNDLTRIGSFKLNPACTVVANGTVSGTVTTNPGGTAISGATVTLGSRTTTTDGSGNYAFSVPAGTYPGMTASFSGRNTATASNIVITTGGTTTQNFSLTVAASSACFTDTTQADFQTGVPTNVDLTTSSGNVTLAKPQTLDQSNTSLSGSGFGFTSTTWFGQTFTAAITGTLQKADINLFCSGCTGTAPNLTLSVRATSGGLPTGADLASTTLTGSASGGSSYFSGTFSSPPSLTAGTVYALIIRPTSNPSAGTYAITAAVASGSSSAYSGGRMINSGNSGSSWSNVNPTNDAGFHTYMNTGFATSGNLISSIKDANPAVGFTANWTTLSWTNAALPAGTALKFQVAASNNINGPFTFVGPDGTATTFFTTSGASLSQFNGFRYLKYEALLSTSNTANTPTLNDVTVCFQDLQDLVFNTNGSVSAGTYNSITVNAPAVVDLTGNVTITGFVLVNTGGRLNLGSSTISGAGTFTLTSGGILGIGSANGITSSGANGNVQGTGTRSFNTGASYVYTGITNQVVGNGLPSTVANLTIANTGGVGSNLVTGNLGQTVTGLLEVQSGIYASASTYHNVQIDSGATLSLSGDVTVSGNWTNNGTFISNGFKVTFDGNTNQSIGGSSITAFANLTIANTGVANNIVSLSQSVSDTSLNVTTGKFDQGASSNLTSGAITVASGATLQNTGTGDLTLSGNVANSGTITFNANGTACGGNDDILIRSSVNGVQRTWSGSGTFSMTDVDVKDQAGSAVITVTSGTNSGNNGPNWIFVASCASNTYTWAPVLGGDWTNAANWTPARTTPNASDVLIFGSNTPSPAVTNVAGAIAGINETIAELHIFGSSPTFSTGGANTLNINAGTGVNGFDVSSFGLTLSGSNALTIKLASGTVGNVAGTIVVTGGAHRLVGLAASAITFQNGSFFTTSTGFTGNPFGDGSAGNGAAGSVVFASGSIYSHSAGSSPFGASANPAVVTFQTGSFARFFTATGFEANGRTYANLEIGKADPGGTAVSASDSGSGNFQFDNLVVNSTGTTQSSLSYTGSGPSTITIQGNITSAGNGNGGTAPDVFLTAGSGGIQIKVPGPGGTATFGNGPGTPAHSILFGSNATVDTLTTLNLGRIVQMGLSPTNTITVNGSIVPNFLGFTGYIIGFEKRSFAGPGPVNFTFDVGTVNGYSPLDAKNTTGVGDFTVTATQATAPVVDATKSLKRYWTLNGSGITTDLTFHYLDPTDIPGTSTEANYRIIRVSGGTAVSFPNDGCVTACVDAANNKATIVGVSSFSDWTVGEPTAPTAVRLTKFDAAGFSDGVEVRWESGFEVDNLGYHIYRERNGQRERVTPAVIAGSALKVGPHSQLRAGYAYSWFDKDGTADAAYYLEAIDLNGTRELVGPIYPSRANGNSPKAQSRAALLSEVNNSAEISSTARFEQSFPASIAETTNAQENSSAERASSANSGTTGVPTTQSSIANNAAVKISVSRTGWYRVTQAELMVAGLDPNSDPRRLQLFAEGVELPMIVNASGSRFASGDSVEFYGQALDTLDTDTHVYWLINGTTTGKRISRPKQTKPSNQDWSALLGGNFALTVERRDKLIYFSSLLNGEESNIFGPVITSHAAAAQSLTVNNLDVTSTQAQLAVTVQGATEVDHQVQVQLNGTPVGTVSFHGREHPTQSFTVSRSLLQEGPNVLTLSATGGDTDVSLVDGVSLTYAHSYRAENNALRFSVAAGQTVVVSAFSSSAIRVIDITNPATPTEVAPQIAALNGGYAFKLQTSSSTRSFMAFTDDLAAHPLALTANQPSSLKTMAAADLLMVTYKDFRQAVEPLAAQRRSEGLTVSVVDIEDVYDEFNWGAHSPYALRDFLSWTNSHGTRPRYLLLVGDSSWDPRNSLDQGFADFVPTKLIDTVNMETASDDWVSDFDGDGVADVATGRLPARTAADATVMVNKILAFEQERQTGTPLRGALLVSDSGFESASQATAGWLPATMSVTTINRAAVGSDDLTRAQIVSNLNNGPLVANYFGHGSVTVWTSAGLLDSDLATSLTNVNRPTLFVLMTCLNGYSHDAYIDSLGESLLKAPQGGAMAVWASSGFTEADPQFVMSSQFYRQLFSSSTVRLGDGFKPAKLTISDKDVQRTWLLLGDPSMRLR